MFTGLIEDRGTVREIRPLPEGRRLVIATGLPLGEISVGDSIAVDGACLTVCERLDSALAFDAGPETLRATTLGEWRAGTAVHLERALAMGARLGGHFVTGHVDGVGRLAERRARGASLELVIEAPPEVASTLVPKGSVAVCGVSLTVNDPAGQRFSVSLIPHTLGVTHLAERRPGDRLNLEADLLGKYVRHFLGPRAAGIDEAFLAEHGFGT